MKIVNVNIQVIKVGRSFLGTAVVGGIRVRGRQAVDEYGAVKNLLWKLAGEDHDADAELGLQLACEGTTLADEVGDTPPALGEGGGAGR